jgi:hypothetical protein
MFNAYVPIGVLALVVTKIVDEPVAGLELNVAFAPLGSPLTLRVTCPVNKFMGLMVTV